MPRTRHTSPPTRIVICLPETLKAEVDLLLFDPVRGKRQYGAFSGLVSKLLRDWIKREQEETND